MNRWVTLLAVVVIATLVAIGCSGGSPVTPTADQEQTPELTTESNRTGSGAQTNLLGYWDFYIDAENGTVELLQNRQAMFRFNLTNILSQQVTGLDFELFKIIIEPDNIDVDIDIIVTHPLPGYPEFNCYDLRAIFMGDGSLTLEKGSLNYPELGVDQYMLPDPIDGAGGPDGYTRWFNFTEFSESDNPLFSYTAGKITTPNFAGTATLCPYKYYADGLQPEEDLWTWLNTNADENGVFSEGITNARNFYIRFPKPEPGLQFSVAIMVNWEGIEPEYHPDNCPEAVACEVTDNGDVYYVDPTENGGNLSLDISLFGWDYQPSTIHIESTVLSAVASFDPATIATGGGDHYSTYQVDISADNVTGIDGQELWVIAEYDEFDYTNDFEVPNLAGTDPLAAFFRYDLEILTEAPECTTTVLGIEPSSAMPDSFINDAIITCIEIEEGPNLDVRLKRTDQPDIIGTDLTVVDSTTLTADFNLFGAEGGLWDVVVKNGCGGFPGVGEEMFLIELPGCKTTVQDIDPSSAFSDSFIDDAIINCTEIEDGPNLDARLVMMGQPDIVGTDLTVIDDTTLTADFDLIGAEAGAWDVVVTNGCGGFPGVGEEMFTIEPPECTTTVLGIEPSNALPDSFIDDAIISCTEIEEGPNLDARLMMINQPDIVGTDLTVVDDTTLTADFDLTGAELGAWDVVVTNGCGGIPGFGVEMFWMGTESYDFHLIDSIDLPDPLPTSDLEFLDFCVIGNNDFGNAGVYYHYATGEPPPGDATYQVYRYPLDYSEPGTHILTFTDSFFDDFNGLMGGPQYMAAIEVPPMGGVVFTSRFPGPITWGGYPGDTPIWWSNFNGVLLNAYIYFNMRFFDLETEFGNDGSVWGYWGSGVGIDGSTIRFDTPFGSGDSKSFSDFYPIDHVGSVDCLVSDIEAYKHAVDSDPQGLDGLFDRIFYYLESSPDDDGIEIFQNNNDESMPECIGTIDDALVGTPVDISCLNTYGQIVDAEGNWLCVLEDNGDSTWQVAIFDQNGILIERYPTPLNGVPFALDCDSENLEIHVWFVHEDTYKYAVFGL